MAVVSISKEVLAHIESKVQAGYPYETCGLLIGNQQDNVINIIEAIQAPNLNKERKARAEDRYDLDPDAMLVADRDARNRRLEIVGVWHSHPDHPAKPSETDRAAAWERWSYMIISVTKDGIADIRSWRLDGDQFLEERIQIWLA